MHCRHLSGDVGFLDVFVCSGTVNGLVGQQAERTDAAISRPQACPYRELLVCQERIALLPEFQALPFQSEEVARVTDDDQSLHGRSGYLLKQVQNVRLLRPGVIVPPMISVGIIRFEASYIGRPVAPL